MNNASVSQLIQEDHKLNRVYTFHKKLSNGCFGHLYLVNSKYGNRRSALKVEIIVKEEALTLFREYNLLKILQGVPGIPKVYNFGRSNKTLYMELQLFQQDLSYLTDRKNSPDLKFICKVGYSMLKILQKIHEKGIIHRDIKPQNMMIDKQNTVYLIDFGISKQIKPSEKLDKRKPPCFVGTPRYASINAHKCKQQTPLDDIQSLMYNLIYMYKRELPWMNVNSEENKRLQSILAMKVRTTKNQLCKDLPPCFLTIMEYLSKAKQGEMPNHMYLAGLFKIQSQKQNIKSDGFIKSSNTLGKKFQQDRKARRFTLEEKLLEVPSQQKSKGNSQKTLEIPSSEFVMGSQNSLFPKISNRTIKEQDEVIESEEDQLNENNPKEYALWKKLSLMSQLNPKFKSNINV